MDKLTKKPAIHIAEAVPVVSFAFARQVAKPTSKRPAMMSMIQFIVLLFCTIWIVCDPKFTIIPLRNSARFAVQINLTQREAKGTQRVAKGLS